MTSLDARLRDGLHRAAAEVPEPDPATLATMLRRSTSSRQRRHRRQAAFAAAVVVAVVAVASILVWPSGQPADELRTATTTTTAAPRPPASLGAFGPGWHELDPGPVPPMFGAALAWSGSELIVGGTTEDGPQVWAYDVGLAVGPDAGTRSPWRQLEGFPFDEVDSLGLVWARGRLLAVEGSFPAARAAVYTPADDRWREIDHPPANAALVAVGQGLHDADRRSPALVWTGKRVLDLTHGSAWNPETGRWQAMAMPGDAVAYSSLSSANPVWTGREVVVSSWSDSPGLAWSADGTEVREIPSPASVGPQVRTDVVQDSVATRYGDGVLLASGTEEGWAVVREGDRPWRAIAEVPGMTTPEGCPRGAATPLGFPVVVPCDDSPPVFFDGSQWHTTGPVPIELSCCMARWLGTPGGLVVWQTDRDLLNGRKEAYREAAVWVPGP